jgi:hypothetical protein
MGNRRLTPKEIADANALLQLIRGAFGVAACAHKLRLLQKYHSFHLSQQKALLMIESLFRRTYPVT